MTGDIAYRLLLRTLPADLRHDFGDDMLQLFRDHRRAVRGRGLGTIRLWIAAVFDVLNEAIAARRDGVTWPAFSWKNLMRASALDVRHGLRLLRRYPASSLLAVATLALGIGANTAIFSVVDRVLIRQLPYPEPDRLVMLWEKRPREGVMNNVVSPADYLDWRRMQSSFEHVAALSGTAVTLTGDGEPIQAPAAVVGWSFFDVLRVPMQLGRTFRAEHETFGTHRVAVISHGLWQRRYGGDAAVVGKRLTLNSNATWEIVGVLPADFTFVENYDLWLPMVLVAPGSPPPTRVGHQLDVYARLKKDVTLAQALDEMDRIGRQLEDLYPNESRGHGAHVEVMRERYVSSVRKQLLALLSAVGLVLLIACVNTASLLLARAEARRREMVVRAALGASRGRLVVQALTESVTLSTVGGIVGIGLALIIVAALPVVMPERLSVVGVSDINLDFRVLAFATGLSLLTGIVFGLLPALSASRPETAEALKAGGRGPAGVRQGARRALVITEVALASLALVGAGLVIKSFATILSQPLGFETDNRLTFAVSVPPVRYDTPEKRRQALADIETRLASLPGARAVGAANLIPLGGGDARTGIAIEGREPGPDDPPTRMHPRIVTPGYFKAMGIRIVKGRGFGPDDHAASQPVVIITETSAQRFWPGADPIGQRIRFGGDENWRTIVGIAADVRHWGWSRDINPMLYWPQPQAGSNFLTFVIASDIGTDAMAAAARRAIAEFDPNLALASMRTMDQVVARSVKPERSQTLLMGTFGVVALLLSVIGIYGVTSQLVTTRMHEIGVRMTLGARPRQILGQLMREGLWQTLTGLLIGLAAGAWLMRLGRALLYGVEPWDPATLAAVSAVLLVAALAAFLVPSRRAMRVDPATTLRAT